MHPSAAPGVGSRPVAGAATSTAADFGHDLGPHVRVHQLGYLPDGPKRATLVTEQHEAVSWLDDMGRAGPSNGP